MLGKKPFIKGLDHAAIVVKDMDKSLEFYSDTLGLLILKDGRDEGGEKKSFLGTKEKSLVALTENPDKDINSKSIESVSHLAFAVDNIEKSKKSLENKGVKFIEEKADEKGKIIAYHFLDPDGFELEIYEESSLKVAPY